ncbi:F-box/kelch-repeat protein At3g06240-like [Actinidia eriantha]|uniref:F-box/kelch-repeat protein At3g06240-like n=1 Tax=Actinidia eriantha TaxID=165200 RepID=UPI002586AF39|nr:F-box/kelch-repeat protein At3g06240-like [Actinidia eriantha]
MINYIEDHYHHHDMPEDMLIEILKRLPVKSLLRFKCICKYWYALILYPTFANHHLNFQKGDNQGRLLLQHYNSHSYQHGYALFPDKTLATTSYHNLDYLRGIGPVHIDGPINGLFCLNFEDRFIIWNPAMKEFRSLPFPYHPEIPLHFNLYCYSFGFGFDPITKDYKVVLRQQFANEITMDFPKKDVIVDVYALSTNTWRHSDGLDYVSSKCLYTHDVNGAYLDGIYYWPTDGKRVLAFDVGNEFFRAILGPDTPMHYTLMTLYDDHIALCGFKDVPESEIDNWIELWVMELEASWIKQFSIEALPRIERPLGFWNNSEFLFEASDSPKQYCNDNSQVVLYDLTTQEFRDIGPKGPHYHFKALTYYESLVSVKGGMHQRTEKLSDSAAAYYFFKSGCRFRFMFDFLSFMCDLQINNPWNMEPMDTDIDHIKVRGMLTRVWESRGYSVDAFMNDFVNFMSDFQISKQWNTKPMYTDIDHIKVRGMLTRVWESSCYSVDLSN